MEDLFDRVIKEARRFWEENHDDFCVWEIDSEYGVIIFGKVNKITWSITFGFTYGLNNQNNTIEFSRFCETIIPT